MICLKCNSTEIDFYLSSTEVIRKYDSTGVTGRDINNIFNPVNQKPYTIKCSKCHTILKKVLNEYD
jgi:predicted nucleic-acid-binding Zn-ribbon protein